VAKVDPTNTLPDIIVEEATRLNGIITDFINFARPRSPKLSPCRLEDILEKNINFLSAQIADRRYEIHKELRTPLPDVMADAPMLYQSFLNLFINAMQSMPDGGRIDVGVHAANGRAVIEIEDQGQGVPQDLLDKIWDPFFTTKDKGTGLGLGIVRNIIESHGGAVRIANRTPHGARVTVELPVQPTETATAA